MQGELAIPCGEVFHLPKGGHGTEFKISDTE